ncbi:MAG: hypothetical protein GZ088_12690 [Acidipila sp.]|nr:hypothetical protein [Acidipila sp.]
MQKPRILMLVVTLLAAIPVFAADGSDATLDQSIDRMIGQENALITRMRDLHPIAEIYIQNLRNDKDFGLVPSSDEYYLGKTYVTGEIGMKSLLAKPDKKKSTFGFFHMPTLSLLAIFKTHPGMRYLPNGFVGMSYIDSKGFNRATYNFEYVRREFLGEVRCLVFDVKAKNDKEVGRFEGRIWVEDQEDNIVRFNGVFGPVAKKGLWYYHFDSWRVQMGPGLWLPAYVYTEETALKYGQKRDLQFKGQVRFWGYNLKTAGRESEFSTVRVDAPAPVRDSSTAAPDTSPVEATRLWDRQAEDNVLERLEKAGLLAPEGEVDKVLSTVVNNLEVTNKIEVEPPVRCRVLLTSTLESFSVGHTIILSRGLLDVLPDEASLASMLAYELGHVLLVHNEDTQYAFADRMMIPDEDVMSKFRFHRDDATNALAEAKAIELLRNSPYKGTLATAGLFLRALDAHSKELSHLISPHLGNRVSNMKELMAGAPALEANRTDQIAALPLGGRIKLEPWNDHVELSKPKAVALLSPREKLPFEITPFWPYLSRQGANPTPQTATTDPKAPTPPQN